MIETCKILTGKYDRAAIPDMHGAAYNYETHAYETI